MSFNGLLTRSVIIKRAATIDDRYGDSKPDWDDTDDTTITGWLSQSSSTEPAAAGRDPEVSTWILYLPADTDITAADRVEIDSVTYEVSGAPNRAHRPGGEHHIEATLQRVEG